MLRWRPLSEPIRTGVKAILYYSDKDTPKSAEATCSWQNVLRVALIVGSYAPRRLS
jgi:hypothetical protein